MYVCQQKNKLVFFFQVLQFKCVLVMVVLLILLLEAHQMLKGEGGVENLKTTNSWLIQ